MKNQIIIYLLVMLCFCVPSLTACNHIPTTEIVTPVSENLTGSPPPMSTVNPTLSLSTYTPSAQTPTPTEEPTLMLPSPTPSVGKTSKLRIVFISNDQLMLWDDQVTRPIADLNSTQTIIWEYPVSISDDGEKIAFMREDGLWIINPDGNLEIQLIAGGPAPNSYEDSWVQFEFDWLPASHQLLVTSLKCHAEGGCIARDDLKIIDADTQQVTEVIPEQNNRLKRLSNLFYSSPDGNKVAVVSPYDVQVLQLDSLDIQSVFSFDRIYTESEYFFYPKLLWTERGTDILFALPPTYPYGDEPSNVWQIDVEGQRIANIHSLPATSYYGEPILMISPDAKMILYSPKLQSNEVHMVNLGDNSDKLYYTGVLGNEIRLLSWSPDSKKIAFSDVNMLNEGNTYIGNLNGDLQIVPCDDSVLRLEWVDPTSYLFICGNYITQKLMLVLDGETPIQLAGDGHIQYDVRK